MFSDSARKRLSLKGGSPGSIRNGAIHNSRPYCCVGRHMQDFVTSPSSVVCVYLTIDWFMMLTLEGWSESSPRPAAVRHGMAGKPTGAWWAMCRKLQLYNPEDKVNRTLYYKGFPGGINGKEPAWQCKRHKRCGFDPWVRKIPRRRAWQPTPVFLPGESHGQRSLVGWSPWGRRVGHTEVI